MQHNNRSQLARPHCVEEEKKKKAENICKADIYVLILSGVFSRLTFPYETALSSCFPSHEVKKKKKKRSRTDEGSNSFA